ncbi:hypothetical protein L873DRAFT_1849083 [Choiromyces venosus 120613-1]|uniref:Glutamyl-tRNA amidotransferase complex subunit Gta3 domain-containing protein n=1 Tax=Choiromyces venosus 120613-1 TaxID=1336337 RepID=A0A3N4IUK8_9PEZI|nr:hypothetical protein L873DRAFT_1849083 [Choiromyces venosus 120613-1]
MKFLKPPTWSVRALLPSATSPTASPATTIPPTTIAHLHRLSALPIPTTSNDATDLRNHLHFVQALAVVDTRGVEPLRGIRDEVGDAAVCMEDLQSGKGKGEGEEMKFDVMGLAARKEGGFYVVDGGVGGSEGG